MQFIHTIDKVLSGEKTMTSRLVKGQPDGISVCGEMLQYPGGIASVMRGDGIRWHVKWQVGRTYAVQPGRTLASKGRIQLLTICQYDVRGISEQEAHAEGFARAVDFLMTWCRMHDKGVMLPIIPDYETGLINWSDMQDTLYARPTERYTAWQLGFKLIAE